MASPISPSRKLRRHRVAELFADGSHNLGTGMPSDFEWRSLSATPHADQASKIRADVKRSSVLSDMSMP
jgi:hypothetical protein